MDDHLHLGKEKPRIRNMKFFMRGRVVPGSVEGAVSSSSLGRGEGEKRQGQSLAFTTMNS